MTAHDGHKEVDATKQSTRELQPFLRGGNSSILSYISSESNQASSEDEATDVIPKPVQKDHDYIPSNINATDKGTKEAAKEVDQEKGTVSSSNQTTAASTDISDTPLKVMIQMKFARRDRLGCNIERPLHLMAYAHCHGYGFCIKKGSEGVARLFAPGFETCPSDLSNTLPIKHPLTFKSPVNESGLYWMGRNDGDLMKWINENEDCAFDDDFRAKWGQMIIDASKNEQTGNTDVAREELFQNTQDPKVVTVAVNIRRGDFVQWGRKPIHDEFYVVLIRKIRSMLQRSGKMPEVHVFSEDYGMIDAQKNITCRWDLYDGIVDHFHLAPDMRTEKNPHKMDMALNLRDWRHFVEADILVVGGTFSKKPGLGRPKHPNPKTGLPLTIHPCVHDCGDKTSFQYGWSKYSYGPMPDKLKLVNLPEAFSKFDDDKTDFYEDLLVRWNVTHNCMQEDATNILVSLSAEKKSAVQKKRKVNKPVAQTRVKELYAKTTALADAGMSPKSLPKGKPEGSHPHDGQDKKTGRQNVSLVTSFFADSVFTLTSPKTSTTKNAHHLHEISAAILKNIHNPYFAQVVVILDGARDEANCTHFREYLENMEKELLEWGQEHANITILHDALMHGQSQQKLTCVNREQGQPNYYEMFQYATNSNTTSPIVTSPIVVLENADHVFDDTLIWAGLIKPNAVLTLPSHGYNKNLTPPEVAAYFQFANRNHSEWDTLKKKLIPDRCRKNDKSWDGYVFHQDYVRGTLDPAAFRRATKFNTTGFFNMNEIGAEDAALWSLLKNLPDDTHSANGCGFIKTWHYHAAPKMHSKGKDRGLGWVRVPEPWRKSKFWQGDNAFENLALKTNSEEARATLRKVIDQEKQEGDPGSQLSTTHHNATIRAVSYSLYGKNPRYWRGMVNVANHTLTVYPNWQVWIYHDHTVPSEGLTTLKALPHVKLINVVTDLPPWVHNQSNPTTWRFHVAAHPSIEVFAIRDADSLPSAREFAAVQEWITSGKALHILRDHPIHSPTQFAPILAGMWGARGNAIPQMTQHLQEYYANPKHHSQRKTYGDDQDFLWQIILPMLSHNVVQHDSYYCREANAIAFPIAREDSAQDNHNPFWFVGNGYAQQNEVPRKNGDRYLKRHASRYNACLEDRQQLETLLQQQQGISRDLFARHVNTTFAMKLRGSPTEVLRELKAKGLKMDNSLYEKELDVSSYIQAN